VAELECQPQRPLPDDVFDSSERAKVVSMSIWGQESDGPSAGWDRATQVHPVPFVPCCCATRPSFEPQMRSGCQPPPFL